MVGITSAPVLNPLQLGGLTVDVPVVLAPMAGITNVPFRTLCREYGGGLFISEMVTARALLERNTETLRMCSFAPNESIRSVQLYGTDPHILAEAISMIVSEDMADHVDLNMGCPVAKVTRKGGGAALPWKLDLIDDILTSSVRAARSGPGGDLPVTVKMRIGIDADHHTYREAAQIAVDAGVSWIALHGRTAQQLYSGTAQWSAIADLVDQVNGRVPVLGNGDIWTADDALSMVAATGCDGVVVGRGCLGRPWLFQHLEAAFRGDEPMDNPHLGDVVAMMRRHLHLLAEEMGEERGAKDFRKHIAWYFKGFSVPHAIRVGLANVSSLDEFDELVAPLDGSQPFPEHLAGAPRGRTSGAKRVALPDKWLDSRYLHGQAIPDDYCGSGG